MFPLVSDVAIHLNCSKTVTNIMCGCFKLHYDDDKMTKLVEWQFITLVNITRFQQFKKLHSSAISVRNSSSMLIPTKYKKSISFLPSFFCVFICSFTCSHVQFESSAVVFWAPPTSSTIGGCRTRGVTRGPWFACLLLWLVSLNLGVNREENDMSKQTELNELNIQLIQLNTSANFTQNNSQASI